MIETTVLIADFDDIPNLPSRTLRPSAFLADSRSSAGSSSGAAARLAFSGGRNLAVAVRA
jgi:hypothetical protein